MIRKSRGELLIVNKKYLDLSFLDSFEHFHNNFPNIVCYVEDDYGKVYGIFSLREYKQSLFTKQIIINTSFGFISSDNEDAVQAYHQNHPNFLSFPYIENGELKSEYNYAKEEWLTPFFEWDAIENHIISGVLKKHLNDGNKIYVSNGAMYDKLCNAVELTEAMDEASLQLLGMKEYYEYTCSYYKKGIYKLSKEVLSEYDFYIECVIAQIIQRTKENDIPIIYFGSPNATLMKYISERDRNLLLHPESVNQMSELSDVWDAYTAFPQSKLYMQKKEYSNIEYCYLDGHYALVDHSSESLNIVAGKRITQENPREALNTIYVYGICLAKGEFCADCDTIESCLQRKINEKFYRWRVTNCGVAEGIIGAALNDFQYILHSRYRKNDIIILLSEYDEFIKNMLKRYGVCIYETSDVFARNIDKRWFVDIMPHTTPVGNYLISEFIFEKISKYLLSQRCRERSNLISMISEDKMICNVPEGITQYVDKIRSTLEKDKLLGSDCIIGSIVMNCNPFTKGHLYLIEQAQMNCDILLIFVVSEDKSIFRFEDRLEMVKEGVKQSVGGDRTYVFESGKYMISKDTFPEYFYKEQIQDEQVDTTYDLRLFSEIIAPELGIKKRFVGEEPTDKITESYNRTMEVVLRDNGIDFCEIKRASNEEGIISATKVRKLMENGDIVSLRKYIPDSTYRIIQSKYLT